MVDRFSEFVGSVPIASKKDAVCYDMDFVNMDFAKFDGKYHGKEF